MAEEARPVGRPRNPTDAEEGYKQEVTAWVKVAKRIRQLIEKMLSYLESQLKNIDRHHFVENLILDRMVCLLTFVEKLSWLENPKYGF